MHGQLLPPVYEGISSAGFGPRWCRIQNATEFAQRLMDIARVAIPKVDNGRKSSGCMQDRQCDPRGFRSRGRQVAHHGVSWGPNPLM